METQPMKGLTLADSGGSSTDLTNSDSGPSNSKRKRSSSDSVLVGVKHRRTTSWEQSPMPSGSSPVKSIVKAKSPLHIMETGYTHVNLKRKRSTSEPAVSSLKRRKVASSDQPVTWNSRAPVRSSSEQDGSNTADSERRVRDSGQAQSIGGADTPGMPSMRDHNRKSKRLVASTQVKRCLLTQELSSEASVSSCYLLNQRLWNSELLSRLEWWWGMESNSLDPRTESNKIYLRRDWLKSFDSERWLLVPSPEMIEKFGDLCDKFLFGSGDGSDPTLIDAIYDGAETFEYRLLPLDDELRSFNRIDWPDSPSETSFPGIRSAVEPRRTRHFHPFHTLPTLVSRAKPHFVICDTAAKLYQRNTFGVEIEDKLKSVWQGHDFKPSSMIFFITETYGMWFTREVPAQVISAPRVFVPITPLHPYINGSQRPLSSDTSCSGPCVRNRFAWMPTCCARCRGKKDVSSGDPNLVYSDSNEDSDTGHQSDRMAQYRAYLRRAARRIRSWQLCCVQQVMKRGRWTSRVVNDKQLGGYSEKAGRTLTRTVCVVHQL
ncbi:hypothetical protein HETIRDRAFT_165992 [Heterobasidion irregulare TC 32-1]|uniref:Uncharacterized protein n=1 Tax=Heterobasidion irregulare (strain TC 32-1) TaxID=747525 RepID=W4KN50_HETIT|nr:uncharacterized protein HETIRDRAFT_165992 [Heterobasidion irregulare TC 32-1]ETW86476.1 hypothetical protein HETIRDRAFT_165992 [Heterobasidion irregulare TC 32-1]